MLEALCVAPVDEKERSPADLLPKDLTPFENGCDENLINIIFTETYPPHFGGKKKGKRIINVGGIGMELCKNCERTSADW